MYSYPNIVSNANIGAVLCAMDGRQQRFQERSGVGLVTGDFVAAADSLRRAPAREVPHGNAEV